MLNEPQIKKLLGKIERFTRLLEPMIFEKQAEVDFSAFLTKDRLHSIFLCRQQIISTAF